VSTSVILTSPTVAVATTGVTLAPNPIRGADDSVQVAVPAVAVLAPNPTLPSDLLTLCVYFSPWSFFSMKQ